MDGNTEENAYQALASAKDDAESRWAFGTGFEDPLGGVGTGSTEVPAALASDAALAALATYCVMLGDDALLLSHRLTQWCSNAPELEEEVALANIGLDLLGQARLLYSRAADVYPDIRPGNIAGDRIAAEDALAYFREAREFRNITLAEAANGDFARSIARLFVCSAWRLALMARLARTAGTDQVLSGIAAKAVKELTYHRDYAAGWVVRLGDGTAYSRDRVHEGLSATLSQYAELFATHPVERALAGAGATVEPGELRSEVDDVVRTVLDAATLVAVDIPADRGELAGRDGAHSPELTELLADMQSVARAYPDAVW